MLRRAGVDVYSAENGESGVALARQVVPDLVVSDYNMPGITGLDVVREVHSYPALSTVPVVILSANENPHVKQRCLDAGAAAFVFKGSYAELAEAVGISARGKQPVPETPQAAKE